MYDATGPQVTATPARSRRLERLVQPLAERQLHRHGRHLLGSTPASRRRPTPAPTVPTRSVSGSCRDFAGNTTVRALRAHVRRERPAGDRDPCARSRFERLVQPFAERQLHGHRRHFRARVLRRAPDLLRPRPCRRVGERLLPRRSRQHHRARVRAHVRRDGAAGDRRDPLPPARFERLVQPRADRRLHGQRRHFGDRHVHGGELLGPGQPRRLGQWLLPRRGRQPERHELPSRSATTRRRRR